jgi:hypothetical protein
MVPWPSSNLINKSLIYNNKKLFEKQYTKKYTKKTNPSAAFREQILDVAEAQCEPEIEPDRLMNDLGRETVSVVADFLHHLG